MTVSQSPESMSIASESSMEDDSGDISRVSTCCVQCPGEDVPQGIQGWFGFKVVGDNIDKNVHARHQTIDAHTQSLHYFHTFAALDRINLSSCSEIHPDIDPQAFNLESLLPSADDLCELKSNFKVHIARVITAFLPCLKPLRCAVSSHIQHRYSTEMSKKTVVVRENEQYFCTSKHYRNYTSIFRCLLACN